MPTMRVLLPSERPVERVAFYVDGLGLTIERSWSDPGNEGWLLRAGDDAFVEILANPAYPTGVAGSTQLVLQVADVDAASAAVAAMGARVVEPPTDKPWGSRNAQVLDPEGMVVNLYTPLA